MNTIEQEVINRLHAMNSDEQREVLRFIETLQNKSKHYTAQELMRLPPDERDRLVAEAFARAAEEDFEVFEAYSEEAIDDES